MSLATFISRIRALENFAFDVAKESAPLVQDAQKKQTAAGLTPDGAPWAPTKDGSRALKDAADHLTARPVADTVEITLKGVDVFHDKGNARLPKRQILPSAGKIPTYLANALHEGAKRAFDKRSGT